MNKNINYRDKLVECITENLTFSNDSDFDSPEKYIKNIFATAGVDYNNPDTEGIKYIYDLVAARTKIDGFENSQILNNLQCILKTEDL